MRGELTQRMITEKRTKDGKQGKQSRQKEQQIYKFLGWSVPGVFQMNVVKQ